MWTSSRRVVLVAAGVLLMGAGLIGAGWVSTHWPIEFGKASTGEIATQDPAEPNAPQGDIAIGFRQGLPDFSGQSEPDPGPSFAAQQPHEVPEFDPVSGREQAERPAARTLRNRQLARNEPQAELLFPAQPASSESDLPSEFPSTRSRLEPSRSARSETIQQTGFEEPASPSRASSSEPADEAEPRVFEPENPRSLRQAQQFPRQVALLDRFQNSEPVEEPQTNSPTPATLDEKPAPLPMKDELPFDPPIREAQPTRIAARTEPPLERNADLRKIDDLIAKGDIVTAHRELSAIYWNQPELKQSILPRIEKTAQSIYFAPQPHYVEPYVIQSGDKLERIGPKYQVTWQYLAMVNKVDPRRIRAGQKLKVIKGPFAVFVDLSDFELTVHAHGFFVKRYTVGIGKDGASPIGKFTVLEKVEKPQYTDPNGKVTAGGAATNPLGTHWIDIGNSFGIHGTIEPDSIGKAESRGCIRMRNEEVAEVYNFLVKGSEVVIRQ